MDFLQVLALHPTAVPIDGRPRVTLTFAQSVDGKIAGRDGKQLILSGKESMVMTHWMRTIHDAILVGIGTARNDDPQLNGLSSACISSIALSFCLFSPSSSTEKA
jgi:hypothetical protein